MKKKILIAEDEKPIARSLQFKLEDSGYQVDIAVDGDDALGRLHEQAYDVLVLDLMMPNTDGFSVLESMKKNGLDTPVVVATNLSQQHDMDRVHQYPFVKGFFVKTNTSIKDMVLEIKKIID